MFNALDPANPPPQSGPLAPKKKPLDSSRPKPAAVTSFNARPDANANAGAVPAMMGDKQKIARPPAPRIAASPQPQATPTYGASGIDTAMAAMADKLHPPRKR